jgi:hypothetical protein
MSLRYFFCPWLVRLYNIFPLFLINRTIFENCFWTYNLCFDFTITVVWKIFHSKKNWRRYDHKCVSVFMWSNRYSCQILMKLEIFGQIFKKFWNIKFHENPSSGSRVVPADGWTDRHNEFNPRFSQFCEGTEDSNAQNPATIPCSSLLTVVAKVRSAKFYPIKFIRIKLLSFPTGAGDSYILQNVDICSVVHPWVSGALE